MNGNRIAHFLFAILALAIIAFDCFCALVFPITSAIRHFTTNIKWVVLTTHVFAFAFLRTKLESCFGFILPHKPRLLFKDCSAVSASNLDWVYPTRILVASDLFGRESVSGFAPCVYLIPYHPIVGEFVQTIQSVPFTTTHKTAKT